MSSMPPTSTSVLCWPKRLFSADDLRRHLTSQRELLLLPKTVITPLAADELRARGIHVSWQLAAKKESTGSKQGAWCVAVEKPDSLVASALRAIERDGLMLLPIDVIEPRAFAAISLSHLGGVMFTSDPALVCCIANKIAGVRAVAVTKVVQVERAKKSLGANVYAIEIPGPTFFEVRQMLRTIIADQPSCREPVATLLKELDGHAHR